MKKKMIGVTVLLLSLMQMAPTGFAPMMAGVSEAFPDASAQSIQFLMTMPGIFVVFLSFLSAWLTRRFSKKLLISAGCVSMMVAGILPILFHGNMALLRLWSALLGIGMGLLCALAVSLLTDYFEGPEKAGLMGVQSGANSLGAMIMSLVGGVLASLSWYLNYAVLLLVLPGFLCCLLFVPGKNAVEKGEEQQKIRMTGRMLKYGAVGMLFLFCFNIVPVNLSMFIAENGIGDAKTAGAASAVCLLGGVLLGTLFGRLDRHLHLYTIPLGFLCLFLGITGIAMSHTVFPMLAGCFVAGSSITFVMPQCMMQVTGNANPAQAAMGTALMLASGNMGTFLTPLLSTAAEGITGSSAVVNRYYVCIGLTFALTVILAGAVAAAKRRAQIIQNV